MTLENDDGTISCTLIFFVCTLNLFNNLSPLCLSTLACLLLLMMIKDKKNGCLTALSCSGSISRVGADVDGLASSGSDDISRALQCLVGHNAVDFYRDWCGMKKKEEDAL